MPPSAPEFSSAIIDSPAPYVAPAALAFGDSGEAPQFVTDQSPLPVVLVALGAAPAALEGSLAESGATGPFAAAINRTVRLTLSGEWQGTVTLLRSMDGGITRLPLTIGGDAWGVYTANANEPVSEEVEGGAEYYLQFTRISGTLNYRISQ